MLEEHMKSPVTRRRLLAGPAGPHVTDFAEWLLASGYTSGSVRSILQSLAGWTDWMTARRYSVADVVEAEVACTALLVSPRLHYARGPNKASLTAARHFVRYLRQLGLIEAPATTPILAERWPIIAAFHVWMLSHRGLRESSLGVYEPVIADLLGALGDEPRSYTAADLRAFVARRVEPHGVWRAKVIVVAVRAFLRFLGVTGRAPVGLEHALPTFRLRQTATIPRYIERDDLQRVIGSCDGSAVGRRRDKAVILLFARLGLRAGEVASLTFGDFDWKEGRIAVSGKNRRPEWLPLPQDVGDAVLAWVDVRPAIRSNRVFTTILAPHVPLTRASATHVARAAFVRANVKAAVNGAHALRHSAATAMLREGATLAGVGAVLRHRSPGTTTIYAKVDFGVLAEIAQPWPEVTSC